MTYVLAVVLGLAAGVLAGMFGVGGGILFVAIVFVVVNLIVDISYALINPRIRLS